MIENMKSACRPLRETFDAMNITALADKLSELIHATCAADAPGVTYPYLVTRVFCVSDCLEALVSKLEKETNVKLRFELKPKAAFRKTVRRGQHVPY